MTRCSASEGLVRRAHGCTRGQARPFKPSKLTFEQAAAVPVSGLTALQGLSDVGRLQAGQRVLVIGASGGVGTYAVQIAKAAKTQDGGSASTDSSEGSSCRRSSGSD